MSEPKPVPERDRGRLPDSEPPTNERWNAKYERLLLEHNDALINYVYSWVRSRADATDIVQEAYVRFFRLGDPTTISHLRAFLFKIAKNIATDFLRKRIVREAFADEESLRSSNESPSPEQIWLAKEELTALQRAIETLPPRTKMALMLVREDGISYEELGQRLGIKTHSARRLIERAMEYLLEAVSEETDNPRRRR
jgi:RNA polymerase sigma-70 factor (ECF subfamily)